MEQQIHIFSGSAESGLDSCLKKMQDKSKTLAISGWFVHDSSAICWHKDPTVRNGKVTARMVVTYRKGE